MKLKLIIKRALAILALLPFFSLVSLSANDNSLIVREEGAHHHTQGKGHEGQHNMGEHRNTGEFHGGRGAEGFHGQGHEGFHGGQEFHGHGMQGFHGAQGGFHRGDFNREGFRGEGFHGEGFHGGFHENNFYGVPGGGVGVYNANPTVVAPDESTQLYYYNTQQMLQNQQ